MFSLFNSYAVKNDVYYRMTLLSLFGGLNKGLEYKIHQEEIKTHK